MLEAFREPRNRGPGLVGLVLGVLMVLSATGLPAQPAPVMDLPFGTHGLELDVYLPGTPGPHPVLVLCHGGSYTAGDKREFRPLGPVLAGRGVAVVAINYRLGGVPDAENETEAVSMVYDDVLESLSWVGGRAGEFGFDPTRVFIGGGSSGGHLAMATGILYGRHRTQPVTLRGVVGMYGGYFTEHLSPGAVPLLILQGTDDRACLPEASRTMAELYRGAGAWCRYVLVEGMVHDWGGRRILGKLVEQITLFLANPGGWEPAPVDVFLPLETP